MVYSHSPIPANRFCIFSLAIPAFLFNNFAAFAKQMIQMAA